MLFQILENEMTNAQPMWFEIRPMATEMHHDILFDALKSTVRKALDQPVGVGRGLDPLAAHLRPPTHESSPSSLCAKPSGRTASQRRVHHPALSRSPWRGSLTKRHGGEISELIRPSLPGSCGWKSIRWRQSSWGAGHSASGFTHCQIIRSS
jgi:hypothetical protein